MKYIDKSIILASKYKQWLDGLTAKGQQHNSYTSSKGKYYYDIIANLIWVQQGLCAYSERRMQDHGLCAPSKWSEGKFAKFEFAGHLDHYDCTLKKDYGWLWANFFLIDADINTKLKRDKKPSGLQKPDAPDYDPAHYLEYKLPEHIFVPSRILAFDTQELINKDISCLGLNFQPIIDIGREYLAPYLFDVEFEILSIDAARRKLTQFFTAFELSLPMIRAL
ncbi:hypothetical protein SAMN05444266_112119 [Chitinophaga jiangningensis]|uniref:Uncharacterized protein n=1 Tax=Chitinophaga jiangningensis TaxID=1419482 RepID=A0A1M7M7X7_9BACT|nr:hypothetical protein [Chitinophaga jiangningensis]SHM86787.1 hypothetical protein SAMN05444266_112119 [Chitinophaga jiangningensis]